MHSPPSKLMVWPRNLWCAWLLFLRVRAPDPGHTRARTAQPPQPRWQRLSLSRTELPPAALSAAASLPACCRLQHTPAALRYCWSSPTAAPPVLLLLTHKQVRYSLPAGGESHICTEGSCVLAQALKLLHCSAGVCTHHSNTTQHSTAGRQEDCQQVRCLNEYREGRAQKTRRLVTCHKAPRRAGWRPIARPRVSSQLLTCSLLRQCSQADGQHSNCDGACTHAHSEVCAACLEGVLS